MVEKSGGERAFVGELHGTTSKSSVFFDIAFFTGESITLFEKVDRKSAVFETVSAFSNRSIEF